MKKEVGLWIDHEQAVLVINLDQEEEIKRISSDIEKRTRYSGAGQPSGTSDGHGDASEDGRDRRFENHLNHYYDEVALFLRDATTIFIMGPGEAKVELQKRLEGHGLRDQIVTIETVDKLTEEQIIASVRQHFQNALNKSS
jgi:hypothetical protein